MNLSRISLPVKVTNSFIYRQLALLPPKANQLIFLLMSIVLMGLYLVISPSTQTETKVHYVNKQLEGFAKSIVS